MAELLAKLNVIQVKSDSSLYVGKDLVVFVHVDDLLGLGQDRRSNGFSMRSRNWPSSELKVGMAKFLSDSLAK